MEPRELEKYDWRDHRCTWRDCIAESLVLATLIGCVLLADALL